MINKILLMASVAVLGFSGAAQAGNYGKDHGYDHDQHHAEKAMHGDIVAVAAGNPDFSTLVTALKAADLVSALQGDGPLTVFAPTNSAFAALPEGTLDDLLKPENKDKLANILKYHVVAGKIKSGDIVDGNTAVESLLGQSVTVQKSEAGVQVDNANVVKADLHADNGVIHVIDAVILPE